MTGYHDLYKRIHADRIIKNLARKYKNKKIVVYGAGIMSKILFENYDTSQLPILAVCDKKFKGGEIFFGYQTISPEKLKELDFDVLLVLLKRYQNLKDYLKYDLLFGTKKEECVVDNFLQIPIDVILKELFF